MQKLITASFILVVLVVIQSNAFAGSFQCKIKNAVAPGVKSIELTEDSLFINKNLEIPLEKSRIKCGNFGKQTRFDGMALGYQVILESCSSEAKLHGHLIDGVNSVAAEIFCDEIK